MLPEDVLVKIFSFCINIQVINPHQYPLREETWHALVHVCRRWRYLVFESSRHLNLLLEYSGRGRMSEVLDVWPYLPVVLRSNPGELPHPMSDQLLDNKVAALESEHHDRIYEIYIPDMTDSRWERFAAAMQKPFPELTDLRVFVGGGLVPVLPDSFLGGSAPRLRELSLESIPFPSMPKLLLSATGLLTLSLWDIPDSGYISPDAMATALTVMTRLETLDLRFRSPQSRPDPANRPLLPPTRFILPTLTKFMFGGVYEYLEDLLARIDAPRLHSIRIIFFMDPDFDVPQLHQLISHAEEFKTFDYAKMLIFDHSIQLILYPKTGASYYHRQHELIYYHRQLESFYSHNQHDVFYHPRQLELQIICRKLDWQLSSLAQVCNSSFPFISALEELEIREDDGLSSSHWKDDVEDAQWLELLDPFTALKNLYLTDKIARRVCDALQELSGERATEVLPALGNVFVRGPSLQPVQEVMVPFVAARQLSDHPVAFHRWEYQSQWNSAPEG
jgi:F-box-like